MEIRSLATLLVLIAGNLSGCAAGHEGTGVIGAGKQPPAIAPSNPWELPQYNEQPEETERALEDFTDQLARACYAEVSRLNPEGLPTGLTLTNAVETCARAKLLHVFDDPLGEKACRR